ncbi:MAG: DISARM system helicase DrmA [Planctomycetales bacterium]|nr:DISARM system helicase DrmA [Planctomycetales bacterium]
MTTSADIRSNLVDSLRLDLVGPIRGLGDPQEILVQSPSRWYLTGFLVPVEAGETQKTDADGDDELEEASDNNGTDDANEPERPSARRAHMPSSVGLSLLADKDASKLDVLIRWGDYFLQEPDPDDPRTHWRRSPREETVSIELPNREFYRDEIEVPTSHGLCLAISMRVIKGANVEGGIPQGTRSISLFLVNRRDPKPDEVRDEGFAFQIDLTVGSDKPFVPRPDLRSLGSDEWDVRVADLQYRDSYEFAVGHSISTIAVPENGVCSHVETRWIPEAEVERVAPAKIKDVQLAMGALALLQDGAEAKKSLMPFVVQYRDWIAKQRAAAPQSPERRKVIANELLNRAEVAANRIEAGINLLSDATVLKAFCLANRAMHTQAARRLEIPNPEWRPFQLAYLLMNLKGIVDPTDDDRKVVDLLFFPTGGGKTEAYLGLAAFTLVLRRLRNPGISSAGLTVLMRYTLRLLTLDQLGRATALICALELERQKDAETLGDWPFEIALWVGRAATPNHMGHKGDNQKDTARQKTISFQNDDRKPSPIPLEECPWCNTKFNDKSFKLVPNPDNPTDLRINCVNRDCEFSRGNPLPIVAVDEPIYRRLPCFMIATVDKFAAMPWTGEVGGFFGKVDRYDKYGFYGPCTPSIGHPIPGGKLPPPELVIQDELHLISGPLGTIAGLYETALDELSSYEENGKVIRPKIIASTATVRRADSQIRALFNRRQVDIFPPPGPDVRDSFFAETVPSDVNNARQYIGVAAQGRSPKRILLRTALALMAAAQKQYAEHKKTPDNPVDPYMTLLGYFNSLRELGGTRRIAEDELRNSLAGYGSRKRYGEEIGAFLNRNISYDVLELTSRVSTDKVADAKRRLSKPFSDKDRVDIALATNMISVGLDITRLGLMLVFGQPKTSSEYIQATSRVGRDHTRPGLVVTVLNLNRPRDRSHYERFEAFHESFYRTVEATSVTPFSPRALDRGLAGTLVALARQGHAPLTPPLSAQAILTERSRLDFVIDAISRRAENHAEFEPERAEELRSKVRQQCLDLLDEWSKIAEEYRNSGTQLQYQREVGAAKQLLYEFLNPDLKTVHPRHQKFRANRSMRDVEPEVNLWMRQLNGAEVEDFADDE